MPGELETLDYAAVVLYLVATLALGLWLSRGMKDERDYFLAGRRLPWWAIGMSLVATDIGATDIIGVGGAAYSHGLAVANFEWIGCVPAMIVAAFVFVPFFWRIGVATIPEYLERRFNVGVRSALAVCWLIFMACNLGVMLLASAKLLSTMMPLSEAACILLTAAVVGGYTIAGGLAAVVYTDAIQCAVMIGGCLLVLLIGLHEVGGVDGLRESLQKAEQIQANGAKRANGDSAGPTSSDSAQTRHTSLILPADTTSPFPWTGILFGLALILSPAYWIGNQAIVQRSLGAKSAFEAKAAYVWGAVLKNAIPFVIAVPGLIGLAMFPAMTDGDQAFPAVAGALLPVGLRGIFVAGFIAALMSSIDSYLNSASTIVTGDLYKRFVNPRAGHRRLLLVGRVVTAALVAWAIVFAFLLTRATTGIYAIFQTLMSFFQGPAFAVLMGGLLWRRATGKAALVAFVCGVATAVALFALSQEPVYTRLGWAPLFRVKEPFLFYSIWAFAVTLLLLIALSVCTRPDSEDKLQYLVFARRSEGA